MRQIATFPNIIETLRLLYGRRPLPFQTLNFRMGSEQRVHPDSIHFNSEPFGMMCGVWVALEDIGPDQGPLVYYPGSHRLPEINFEDAGIEPSYDNYSAYEAFIEKLIEEQAFEPRYGTVRKGQAIIWSANVLHGGSPHRDKRLTRHSQVTHYYFSGCRYWKPGYSQGARHYYTPWWIPYPGAGLEVAKSRARWFLKRRLGSLVGKQKA